MWQSTMEHVLDLIYGNATKYTHSARKHTNGPVYHSDQTVKGSIFGNNAFGKFFYNQIIPYTNTFKSKDGHILQISLPTGGKTLHE